MNLDNEYVERLAVLERRAELEYEAAEAEDREDRLEHYDDWRCLYALRLFVEEHNK